MSARGDTSGHRLMRRSSLVAIAATACLIDDASAAEFSGYAVLTSNYVSRGVSRSDRDAAAQLGLDVGFDPGVYAGIWGTTVDIENGPLQQRDTEVSYYLGYLLDLGESWSLNATFVAYTYPGADTFIDYDYNEFTLSAGYQDRLWLEYSYSPDLYDSGYETHNVELSAEWPLGDRWTSSAGVGYYDTSRLTGAGYGYWQAGITRHFSTVDVDARYHDTNRWVRIVSNEDTAAATVSISLRVSF